MVSIGMKGAYFHVPIHRDSKKSPRFVFQDRVFQFWALCFGLSTAPQVFTKVFAPVMQWLHLMGVTVCLYLDDSLLRLSSKKKCTEDFLKTLQLTQDLGILINQEESQVVPTQSSLLRGEDRLSEFSGFSVRQENTVVHPENLSLSRSPVLLCQRLDEPF